MITLISGKQLFWSISFFNIFSKNLALIMQYTIYPFIFCDTGHYSVTYIIVKTNTSIFFTNLSRQFFESSSTLDNDRRPK